MWYQSNQMRVSHLKTCTTTFITFSPVPSVSTSSKLYYIFCDQTIFSLNFLLVTTYASVIGQNGWAVADNFFEGYQFIWARQLVSYLPEIFACIYPWIGHAITLGRTSGNISMRAFKELRITRFCCRTLVQNLDPFISSCYFQTIHRKDNIMRRQVFWHRRYFRDVHDLSEQTFRW